MKKKVTRIILSLLLLAVIAIVICYSVLFNEVNAYLSIKKVDDNIYSMTYKNDYYFDDFLNVGARTDEELTTFISKKILKSNKNKIELADYGCSSFTFQTESDNCLARNLDMNYSPIMVVKTKPKNGLSSISLVNLDVIGLDFDNLPNKTKNKKLCLACPFMPFDGVNEKGVAINVNMVNGQKTKQNTGKIPLTTTTLIRLVLDKASSVENAIDLIKKYDFNDSTGGPYHFMIADSTGKSVIVEYVNNEIIVIETTKNYQCLTNHDMTGLREGESSYTATYERLDCLNNALELNDGKRNIDEAINLLQDVKQYWEEYPYNILDEKGELITMISPEGGTLYSAIYNLDKKELTFIYQGKTDKKYSFKL